MRDHNGRAKPAGAAHISDERADRAPADPIRTCIDSYENALVFQVDLEGDAKETIAKDREILDAGRKVVAQLKHNPDFFNSGLGFLLLGNLDDASRNMSVCMGQAGMQAAIDLQVNQTSATQKKLQISQGCRDASILLYTVSETAFNLFSQYLLAEHDLKNRMMSQLDRCVAAMKEQSKKH